MEELTINELIKSAKNFCLKENNVGRKELYGITDGKAIGTFVEHLFQDYLKERYEIKIGSSANGLDLPSIQTDIKVTSIKQPQSSCPYKHSKQKIFGLGYNLIIFVYQKRDDKITGTGQLEYISCTFIDKSRTGDFQTTSGLLNIINNNGNCDDIFAFLVERNIPSDEITLMAMAREILNDPPKIGYLTISNTLQWRLQYSRIVSLKETITGIIPIINNEYRN